MLAYNIRLAWKSIRRNPVLSALIVLGIALGVSVATTFITIYHVLAKDPLPGKSDKLHYVRLDTWGGLQSATPEGPPRKITYRDMAALLKSGIPVRQAGTATAELVVRPEGKGATARPFREAVRLTHADFFPMFGVPFRYGSGWGRPADKKPEAVAVIGAELNDRLFGGEDSVGRTIRLEDRDFRIVGVIDHWQPPVRYYDLVDSPLGDAEQVFVPFDWLGPMEMQSSGSQQSWDNEPQGTYLERLQSSERLWLGYWVELPDAERVEAYRSFLASYVTDQHKLGRFPRSQDFRVTPMVDFMEELEVVPPQAKSLALISILFLAVAAVNLIGLFLGKFLARASIVGIRRALGASRRAIFLQHLVECEVVALLGGAAGLAIAFGTLALINGNVDNLPHFRLDAAMAAAAVFLSLVAGAVAGVYPAWRICAIPPARHLKNQ
ncbi:MAG TPA: ABC transporter permease [Thermoanaerobaculia bacterium]|nr:ABC transporter permease [Thermoanaerobaculia bacterium]